MGGDLLRHMFQAAHNSAVYVTSDELGPHDGATQLVDLVLVLQAQNEQLLKRLDALERVVGFTNINIQVLETLIF